MDSIVAHMIRTGFEVTGDVAFSDPLLTSTQKITQAAARNNFMSNPTDCPTRLPDMGHGILENCRIRLLDSWLCKHPNPEA